MGTWVIGDIHGCFDKFSGIKNKIELRDPQARMILIGDILDRGQEWREMLHWCMENVNGEKFQLLMGNHERMKLDKGVLSGLSLEELNFLSSRPYYEMVEIGNRCYIIAHAWAPKECCMKEILAGQKSAADEWATFLWECHVGERYASDTYYLVHGHTPTVDLKSNKPARIKYFENTINVDCGAVFSRYGGCLAALSLDDGTEIYQE